MTKTQMLMGASALAMTSLAFAGAAEAQTAAGVTAQIYGEGSTLIGPYLRVVANCYGGSTQLITQGAYPYGTGTEGFIPLSPFSLCAAPINSTVQINYLNSGSGNGELGVFTHDVGLDAGTTTDGTNGVAFTGIQFGAGDYGIGGSEVHSYNNGGVLSQTDGHSAKVTILANGDTTATGTDVYANPAALYGAFIQVPMSIDAVAIAYSPVYKVVNNAATNTTTNYSFDIKTPNADKSGGLRLTMPVVCAIFNGAITDWNDPAIQYLNGGVSLMSKSDPAYTLPAGAKTAPVGYRQPHFSVPIQMDGRADSSGTTSIFYRALAAQCAGATQTLPIYTAAGTVGSETVSYTNGYASAGGKKLPGPNGNNKPNEGNLVAFAPASIAAGQATLSPGQFHTWTGSTMVATAIGQLPTPAAGATALHGDIGYIGTDYVIPATNVAVGGINSYGLNVANLAMSASATVFIEPTSANALKAFGTGVNAILPPQSTAAGVYAATSTSVGLRTAPQDWAEPISTTVTYSNMTTSVPTPLASPTTAGAYPIVGTTNLFLNTCYTASDYSVLRGFLTYYFTNTTKVNKPANGLLADAGFGILPTAWRTAINTTFFNPTLTSKVTKPVAAKGTVSAVPGYTTYAGTALLNLNILPAATPATQNGPNGGTLGVFGGQCASVTTGA